MNYSPLKYFLITIQILCTTLFSGILFGWAPFQLIMIEEGLYSCSDEKTSSTSSKSDDSENCISQQSNLNLLFTIATSTFMISSLFIGFFVDYYGPTLTIILNGIVVSLSLFLIGIAPVEDEGLFVLIALLLGLGGSLTLTGSFPIGFVVDPAHMPIIISAINCFFDASAVIFLFCYLIYSKLMISRLVIFVVFGFIAVGLYGLLSILWYFVEPEFNERKKGTWEQIPESTTAHIESENSISIPPISSVHTQSWIKNLPTRLFYFISVYGSLQVLRINIFFGTILQLLEYLGDDSYHHLYTQIFIALLPLGFVCLPAIEYLFKEFGFVGSFHALNVLSFAYSITLLIPYLPIQVFTFIFFVSARALMYSLVGTFIAHMFGPLNSGKMYGAFSWVGTFINVLQYPLFIIISRTAPGYSGFIYLNIFLLSLCFPLLWLCHSDLKIILSSYTDVDIKKARVIKDSTIIVTSAEEDGDEVNKGIVLSPLLSHHKSETSQDINKEAFNQETPENVP